MKTITTTEILTGGGLLNCIDKRRKDEGVKQPDILIVQTTTTYGKEYMVYIDDEYIGKAEMVTAAVPETWRGYTLRIRNKWYQFWKWFN